MIYVLDTSAWLTLIEDEEGADTVQEILENASAGNHILVSFMTFMEVFYISIQENDINEAPQRLELIQSLPIQRKESSSATGLIAAEFKARFRMSVADAWIGALAREVGGILVHKDPEFEELRHEIRLLKLPYIPKI